METKLLSRNDFKTIKDYIRYTATNEFQLNYLITGKTSSELQYDLVLSENQMDVLDQALDRFTDFSKVSNLPHNAYLLYHFLDDILEENIEL